MHGVVDGTRHRVGDTRTEGRTETTRDDLAGRWECRRAAIVPERAGVGEGGNLDPRILGQEVERRLQLETGAPYNLFVIGIGVVAALLLWVVIYRTKFGVMLRATSQDRRMASALGINVGLVYMSAFAIGCFMAGLGGAIIVPSQAAVLGMGFDALILAFVVVVIGGLGSLQGALVGALIVSFVRTAGIQFFSEVELAVLYLIAAVVLPVKPTGLFGDA